MLELVYSCLQKKTTTFEPMPEKDETEIIYNKIMKGLTQLKMEYEILITYAGHWRECNIHAGLKRLGDELFKSNK